MKTRVPSRSFRLNPRGNFKIGFLCALLFLVPTAAAGAVDEPLDRVESKISAVKLDLIRLYQSGLGSPGQSAAPSPKTTSGQSVSGGGSEDVPAQPAGMDLQSIAKLMARLETDDQLKGLSGRKDSPEADDMRLALADELVRANLSPEAEKTLKALVNQTRRGAVAAGAWFRLEKIRYRQGDYRGALAAFQRIPPNVNGPFQAEADYLAGNSYLYLKEFMKAIELLGKVAQGSDYYPYGLYSSGLAYLNLGDAWSSTQQHFQKILLLNPGDDPVFRELINRTRITLGFLFVDQKRYPEAMSVFEAVPRDSHFWVPARFGMGKTYIGLEDCVKAIVIFKDLIREFPDNPYVLEARLHIGSCYSKLSAYRHAVGSYQNALKAYAERSDRLKQLTRTFQTAKFEDLPVVLGPGPTEGDTKFTPVDGALVAAQNLPEWMGVYSDWDSLNREISFRVRGTKETGDRKKADLPSKMKPLQARMTEIHRDLVRLLRSGATEFLSTEMAQLDDLALRANVGIAKSMTFMQNHEAIP
jgi:tetratricopeptide (TPR) repeat protein